PIGAPRCSCFKSLGCASRYHLSRKADGSNDSTKPMTSIVQVEYRLSLLSIRQEILESLGHPVISVVGSRVPLVALLRSRDDDFSDVDYNCRADDPPLWVRTVAQALAGIE